MVHIVEVDDRADRDDPPGVIRLL